MDRTIVLSNRNLANVYLRAVYAIYHVVTLVDGISVFAYSATTIAALV